MKKKLRIGGKEFEVDVRDEKGYCEVEVNGKTYSINVADIRMYGFSSVLIGDESLQVNCRKVKEGDFLLTIGHNVYEVMFQEAMIGSAMADEGGVIMAPMPGLVAEIHVALDDVVTKGQPLLILEAMKMQNEITAKSDGVVKELRVAKGDTVGIGQKMVVIEGE